MGVKVDRNTDLITQHVNQRLGSVRLEQACHILNAEHVRTHALQLFGDLDVIGKRKLLALGVEDVARITNRRFANLPGPLDRLHGNFHIGQPVERIENAEDVDALLRRFFHKATHGVVRIRRVTDGIRRAQQHLEADIRNGFPQPPQSLPRVLVQEAHRDVERRTTPHLEAIKIREPVRYEIRNGQHVIRSYPRGQ